MKIINAILNYIFGIKKDVQFHLGNGYNWLNYESSNINILVTEVSVHRNVETRDAITVIKFELGLKTGFITLDEYETINFMNPAVISWYTKIKMHWWKHEDKASKILFMDHNKDTQEFTFCIVSDLFVKNPFKGKYDTIRITSCTLEREGFFNWEYVKEKILNNLKK